MDSENKPYNTGSWSQEEINKLLQAVSCHGTKSWQYISCLVNTRSVQQCVAKWRA